MFLLIISVYPLTTGATLYEPDLLAGQGCKQTIRNSRGLQDL